MTERLFTLVLDFDGGTFLYQIEAPNAQEGRMRWGNEIDLVAVGSTEEQRASLLTSLREDDLSLVDGLTNVWCTVPVIAGKAGLLHIVGTSHSSDHE